MLFSSRRLSKTSMLKLPIQILLLKYAVFSGTYHSSFIINHSDIFFIIRAHHAQVYQIWPVSAEEAFGWKQLFYIVCESDYDCLFYQAIMNAIYEQKNEIAPDTLFTHCGGKNRMNDVVSALKAVDVPVIAICDFDILN